MATLFGALLGTVVVLVWLVMLVSGATFCAVKLFELLEIVQRRRDHARLRERIAELEAALARATAGGVYRAATMPPR